MIKMNPKFRKHLLEDVFKDLLDKDGLYDGESAGAPFGLGLIMKETVEANINFIKNNTGLIKLTETLYMNGDKMYCIDTKYKEYYTITYDEYSKRFKYIQDYYDFEAKLEAITINFIDGKLTEALKDKFKDDVSLAIFENKNILLKGFVDFIPTLFSQNLVSGKFLDMDLSQMAEKTFEDTKDYINYRDKLTIDDDEILITNLCNTIFYYMKLYIKYFIVIQVSKLIIVANLVSLTSTLDNNYNFYKETLSNIVDNNKVMEELLVVFKNNEDISSDIYNNTSAFTLDIIKTVGGKIRSITKQSMIKLEEVISRYLNIVSIEFKFKPSSKSIDVMERIPVFLFYAPKVVVDRIENSKLGFNDECKYIHIKEDSEDYNKKANMFINNNTADLFCVFDKDSWCGLEKQKNMGNVINGNTRYNDSLLKSFRTIGFSIPFTYSLAYDAISVTKEENYKLVLLDPENEDDENLFNDFIFNQKMDFDDIDLFDNMYQDSYDEFYYKRSKYGLVYVKNKPVVLVNISSPLHSIMSGIIYKYKDEIGDIHDKDTAIKELSDRGIYPFTQLADYTRLSYYDSGNMLQLNKMCVIFILELIKYLESKQNDGSISIRMVEYEKVKAKKRSDVTFEITERKSSWVRAHYRHYKSGIVTLVTAHHRKGCHLNKNTNEKLIINL